MDVLLQRHCAKYIYVVPEGLRELMSDISREVLRSQPDTIYSFIADYLDALLITRENARVAARLVESLTQISTTIANLLIRTGMTREQADKVATIIQTTFRKHLADKTEALRQQQQHVSDMVEEANIITEIIDEADITPEQAEQAATIIQKAYRNFKLRQERETDLLKGMVDWRVAARSTMRLYRKTGVTYEEANQAATLIKAAYKGYYTRRVMKRLLEESDRVSEEQSKAEEEEEGDEEYTPIWDRFGQEESAIYEDIREIQKEGEEAEVVLPEAEEDVDTMIIRIVDSLLKRVVPGSVTSIPSGIISPPPSEIAGTEPLDEHAEDVSTQAVSEAPAEGTTEASAEGAAEATTEAATETPAEGIIEAPADEATETSAEAPSEPTTEVLMAPEADAGGTETDDTTATEMQTTDTEATTTEEA